MCNQKFYFNYERKVEIVDQETGYIIKNIELNFYSIDTHLDCNGNIYVLDNERSMIVVYDFNGDLLDQIQLINSPGFHFDIFIDEKNNSRFIFDDKKITDSFKIIPDYF